MMECREFEMRGYVCMAPENSTLWEYEMSYFFIQDEMANFTSDSRLRRRREKTSVFQNKSRFLYYGKVL